MASLLAQPSRLSPIAQAVATGLGARQKWLPPQLLYDARGSALFEAITELPEYYLSRTERGIFEMHGRAIVAAARRHTQYPSRVVELGAGTAVKTQILLSAFVDLQGPTTYVPVDVSAEALASCAARLGSELPLLQVMPRIERNEDAFEQPASRKTHLVVLFVGSSIGNLDDDQAVRLLSRARAGMRPGDSLVLGADRVDATKTLATILAAYDDTAGVTAAFNRNVLVRINREMGARFDVQRFAHRASWNPRQSSVEMHLVSDCDQRVRVDALGRVLSFRARETIHTETSIKYTHARIGRILVRAGFERADDFLDDRGWFGVHVAFAAS